MKLYNFNQWKADALIYWTDRVSGSPNGLQGTPASGAYPYYANIGNLTTFFMQELNNLETKYNAYKTDPSLLDKTKDSLLSLMSYISMKDIVTVKGGPVIPNILSDMRDWYSLYTYDLPDKTSLFILNPATEQGAGYLSNAELIANNRWYADGVTLDSPPATGSYSLITNNGLITSNTVTGVNLVAAVSLDKNNIDVFSIASQGVSKDNIIYRMYGEPESIVSKKKAKPIVLEDYKFQLVLNDFGWTIAGLN